MDESALMDHIDLVPKEVHQDIQQSLRSHAPKGAIGQQELLQCSILWSHAVRAWMDYKKYHVITVIHGYSGYCVRSCIVLNASVVYNHRVLVVALVCVACAAC
eukprot:1128025_1